MLNFFFVFLGSIMYSELVFCTTCIAYIIAILLNTAPKILNRIKFEKKRQETTTTAMTERKKENIAHPHV